MNYIYIWLFALAGTNILAQQVEKISSTLSQTLAEATAFAVNSAGTFAIATDGKSTTLMSLDPKDPQSRPLHTQESEAHQIFLSKTGKKAVFINRTEPTVALWTIDDQNMQPHPFSESFVADKILISSDENWVTTLKEGAEPMLWDISNPRTIRSSSFPEKIGKIRALSDDGTYIVTGKPGKLLLWNMGEPTPQSSPLPNQLSEIDKIFAVSPNRELAIIDTIEEGDNIKLWNLKEGSSHSLPRMGRIVAAVFTSNSSVLISRHLHQSSDRFVQLLNCSDPQNITVIFAKFYDTGITEITLLQELKCALLTCLNRFVDLLPLETSVFRSNAPSGVPLASAAAEQ